MGTSIPFRADSPLYPRSVPPVKRGGRAIRHTPARAKKLRGLSEIRCFFQRNDLPIYFFSATPFNLLGIDEWVHRFRYVNYVDCFDGQHPNVFIPDERPHGVFQSLEEIVNYLLEHPQTAEYVKRRGDGGKAVFLFFDEQSEKLSQELGLDICFPPAKLRTWVDDKINTVRIGNSAGVRSVPNVLSKGVDSYEKLRKRSARLGDDLVVQTSFGDSGHTTFFIASEKDWNEHADEIVGEGEIKIMKRVNVRGAALEACITREGTIVGPLMTELVGFKELTPYRGGWCGNEVVPEAFPAKVRERARKKTVALGAELAKTRLSRLLRSRLADRPRHRCGLPRRGQPAHHRRELDDQSRQFRARRRTPLPVSSAGVHGHRLRARCGGDQSALVRPGVHRTVESDGHQVHRRPGRAHRARRALRCLAASGREQRALRPAADSPPHRRSRGRGVLPAHRRARATICTKAPTSASCSSRVA